MPVQTPRQQLDALADLFVPDIRNAFLAAIDDIVNNLILQQVIDAIEEGDVEKAFRVLGFSDAALRPLTAAIERAYETGGIMTGRTFPRFIQTANGKAVFRFDVRNARAERYLRDKSSELVSRIGEDTRVNIRNTLTVGMQQGRNPRNVALDIVGRIDSSTGKRTGGIVGLNQQQEYWVRSAERYLSSPDESDRLRYLNLELRDKRFDGIVQRAIDSGKPLDADTVSKLITRYKDNALKFRGDSIARTEAMQSLNASEWEATKQAIDLGAALPEDVTREWDSAGDRRVRPSHVLLNGQKRGLDEPFVSPLTHARMMHPGDVSLGAPAREIVMCRCRVRTVIDWLAGALR